MFYLIDNAIVPADKVRLKFHMGYNGRNQYCYSLGMEYLTSRHPYDIEIKLDNEEQLNDLKSSISCCLAEEKKFIDIDWIIKYIKEEARKDAS
jgi:hypothetical protein